MGVFDDNKLTVGSIASGINAMIFRQCLQWNVVNRFFIKHPFCKENFDETLNEIRQQLTDVVSEMDVAEFIGWPTLKDMHRHILRYLRDHCVLTFNRNLWLDFHVSSPIYYANGGQRYINEYVKFTIFIQRYSRRKYGLRPLASVEVTYKYEDCPILYDTVSTDRYGSI